MIKNAVLTKEIDEFLISRGFDRLISKINIRGVGEFIKDAPYERLHLDGGKGIGTLMLWLNTEREVPRVQIYFPAIWNEYFQKVTRDKIEIIMSLDAFMDLLSKYGGEERPTNPNKMTEIGRSFAYMLKWYATFLPVYQEDQNGEVVCCA